MSSRIRIQEHTSLNAIASWLQVGGEGLVFCLSGESSFAPLTEGVALGVLIPLVAAPLGFNISADRVVEVVGAVVTIGGIIFTLYRRFVPGLKPMFSKGA